MKPRFELPVDEDEVDIEQEYDDIDKYALGIPQNRIQLRSTFAPIDSTKTASKKTVRKAKAQDWRIDEDWLEQPTAQSEGKSKQAEGTKHEKNLTQKDFDSSTLVVLIALAGEGFQYLTVSVLKDRILKSIADLLRDNPGMVLRGRTADFYRINFDPSARDVTGIRSRMDGLVASGLDHQGLERMLWPLASSNRKIFKIPYKKLSTTYRLDEAQYRSFWSHRQSLFDNISPITWHKRDAVIRVVVGSTRNQCKRMDPQSHLLRIPMELLDDQGLTDEQQKHAESWSLYGVEAGLAGKIRACFLGSVKSAEVYEDLIEQVLYSYKRANKTAIYGKQEAS